MEKCNFCGELSLNICCSCGVHVCRDHKLMHEQENKECHNFKSIRRNIISQDLEKKLEKPKSEKKITRIALRTVNKKFKGTNKLRTSKNSKRSDKLNKLSSMDTKDAKLFLEKDYSLFLEAHTSFIQSLASTKDNKYIVSCGFDSSIIIWELPSRRLAAVLTGHIS